MLARVHVRRFDDVSKARVILPRAEWNVAKLGVVVICAPIVSEVWPLLACVFAMKQLLPPWLRGDHMWPLAASASTR